ncbi:MAG: NAD-dependent nucleoside diphosphate-sugar epimerase/dehydratase [bacterium]|nr:MAG: NAD-dependent nucleoside diphosphate-sugar epimerase/dehydratase [bacterium]
MKIFVAGGSGFVGSRIVALLTELGHDVACLVRRPDLAKFPDSVVVLQEGDALNPASVAQKISGYDAVINLIGIIRDYPSKGVTFRSAHVDATQNMVHIALEAGIKRFLQMSANGTSPEGTEYQVTKYEAEEIVKSSGLDFTIFRPSVMFGPPPAGRTEFCSQLAGMIRRLPVIPIFDDGSYCLQPIHVDDVARCFVSALDSKEAVGLVLHLGGDDVLSYGAALDFICIGMGISPRKKISLPWRYVKPLFRLLEKYPSFPATHYQIDMLLEGNTIPENDFKKLFGIRPKEFSFFTLNYLTGR